jgi:hypothetical protein
LTYVAVVFTSNLPRYIGCSLSSFSSGLQTMPPEHFQFIKHQ